MVFQLNRKFKGLCHSCLVHFVTVANYDSLSTMELNAKSFLSKNNSQLLVILSCLSDYFYVSLSLVAHPRVRMLIKFVTQLLYVNSTTINRMKTSCFEHYSFHKKNNQKNICFPETGGSHVHVRPTLKSHHRFSQYLQLVDSIF